MHEEDEYLSSVLAMAGGKPEVDVSMRGCALGCSPMASLDPRSGAAGGLGAAVVWTPLEAVVVPLLSIVTGRSEAARVVLSC